jgi:hypothetical protein
LCLYVPRCYLGSDGTYLDNQALKRLYDLQDYSDFLRYTLFLYIFCKEIQHKCHVASLQVILILHFFSSSDTWVTRRFEKSPIFQKVAQTAKKGQNISNKAQFESPKNLHQTTFETFKYLQQTMF